LSRVAVVSLCVLCVGGAAGCSSSTAAKSGAPRALDVVSGSNQTGVVGTPLPNPLVVKVVDAAGNAVSGQIVNWVVTGGAGGSLYVATGTTDNAGEAQNVFTLGTQSGVDTVQARAVSSSTGSPQLLGVFTATATPGPAASIAVSAGSQQSAPLGATLPESLVVLVVDRYQNPVSGATVTWTPAANDGVATPPTSATTASGIAKSRWTLGQVFGANSLVASVSGVPTGASFTASASSGPPAMMTKIAGDTQTTVGFSRLPVAPSVRVTDAHGNVTPGTTVTFSIASGGGQIAGGTVTTDANGVATGGTWTVGLGANSLTAHAGTAQATFTASGVALSASAIAVGQAACVVTQTGAPACWGFGINFATGFITESTRAFGGELLPGLVPNAPSLSSIVAGTATTCGVTAAGTGYCWGAQIPVVNICPQRQCEGAANAPQQPPTAVPGGMSLAQIVLGGQVVNYFGPLSEFACLLTTSGAAYCYGQNAVGQLGDGMPTAADTVSTTPVAVTGGHVFAELAAGAFFACGIESGGAVYCWGADSVGQLGDGGATTQPSPVQVGGGLIAKSMVAGAHHACALNASGSAYCWGANTGGQLGDGTMTNHSTPVAVSGGLTFATLAAGGDVTCGITTQSAAYCWGNPGSQDAPPVYYATTGSLGDGTSQSRAVPTAVSGGLSFHAIATSGTTTCGLTAQGFALCWGQGNWGMLGDGAIGFLAQYVVTPGAVAPVGFTPPTASRVRPLRGPALRRR
jgi:hypothetical protein